MTAQVSLEVDPYIAHLFDTETLWIVDLSDGTEAYQDDGREGADPPSAWERLGNYCKETNLYITKMRFQNGTHVETVGADADGFYFRMTAGGVLFSDTTFHGCVAGTLNNGKLVVSHWSIPDLIKEWSEEREASEDDISLITKPGVIA